MVIELDSYAHYVYMIVNQTIGPNPIMGSSPAVGPINSLNI